MRYRTSYCYFCIYRYKFRVVNFCRCSQSYLRSSGYRLPIIFVQRIFSASDHRGICSVANYYFLLLSTRFLVFSSSPLYFGVHRSPLRTKYHIRFSGSNQEGYFFQFLPFSLDHPVLALFFFSSLVDDACNDSVSGSDDDDDDEFSAGAGIAAFLNFISNFSGCIKFICH